MTSTTAPTGRYGHLADQVRSEGYAHLPELGVSAADLAETRRLLDGLFDRFDELPADKAHDLGTGGQPGRPTVPEVLDCSTLEPRLRDTAVWAAAHEVARAVLGSGTYSTYDHAIYKPPGIGGRTSWHQDAGFDQVLDHGLAIWVPFQDTDVVDGCMRYVPRSHLAGRMEHLTRIGPGGKEVFHLEVDDDSAVDVPCRAGGVTMHDFYMVHGAGQNHGEHTRRAWVIDFATAPLHKRALRGAKRAVLGLRGQAR
ncbi:phytanoyl-CoA dioxygenase family protein [Klenkia brasiliensis]|uniref:Phytanoyl-CoA dioxygenase (PhyH) n=1 Tax=Klenkia brasiliensis TaxID=333142 RepID=A0A1G7MU36_9ACTN|nr:phytanoyl-CoA dioxygenase family protein [Klenkia brasiliensis]SDF65325.1 Phytanoyl-CoA dioxygenase (PhyH) [Klenkia brasiliensis]